MTKIRVVVERIDGYCDMPMLIGDQFFLEESRLFVPDGKYICMWALQSMMPIFPVLTAKEGLKNGHWIKKVKHFTCPDPKGKVIFRLETIKDD
jgi:anaerobic carbon-monoxide dehydrogenase iron sulfur subunit